jgi:phage-related protein
MNGRRPALFHPKALEAIRSFPKQARREIGEAILEMQGGSRLTMPLSRPMRSVGAGAYEIRVRDAAGIYRAFYVLESARGVIVFHAFEKRTQRTPPHEIELGRRRLREMS